MADQQKYCLITGAAGGIGRALVEIFGEAGYLVIALDRRSPIHGIPYHAWLEADLNEVVHDEKCAAKLFDNVGDILGDAGLNTLINNAAVQILGGFRSLTREDWRHTLDINLLAPFVLTQGLFQRIEKAKGGVINIGSIHARLTKKNFVAYATSKAALAGLTRAAAVDVGSSIRINVIEPAAIETEMLKAGFVSSPESLSALKHCHPQQRLGQPSEVARLALAIAKDEMRFLHGACIGLDGGIGSRLYDPD